MDNPRPRNLIRLIEPPAETDVDVDCPGPGGETCADCGDHVDAIAAVLGRASPMEVPDDAANPIVYRCPTCATLLSEALRDLAVAAMLPMDEQRLGMLLAAFQVQRAAQRAFSRGLSQIDRPQN